MRECRSMETVMRVCRSMETVMRVCRSMDKMMNAWIYEYGDEIVDLCIQ